MICLRSLIIWLIIIAAEVIHGILRGLFLAPVVGDFMARQIAVFTGIIIIFTTAFLSVRWIRANRPPELIMVGFIWLGLTLTFEILFGHFVVNYSWDRIFEDYNIAKGGLLPIGLLAMTLSPLAAWKVRKISEK